MQRPIRGLLAGVARRTSLHMPATGGRSPFRACNPYRWDTTELPVTDDLYHPTGAIAQAEALIARSAGSQTTLLLHGGSTAGVHTMILYACKRGDAIVLPRNAHASCLGICSVAGLTPVFAEPSFTREGRLYTTPEAYARALDANPTATAALALRMDYYGLLVDLPAIAQVAHTRGKLLLCDEAHGAYCNWRGDLPNAGACGADLFVQSAHKTLPALTPGAWLHAGQNIDAERLRGILRLVQTSSPSFITMLALDDARAWMDVHGQAACHALLMALDRFRAKAALLGYADGQPTPPAGLAYDRLRLVIFAPEGGALLQKRLQARKLDVEMSDDKHVVCILPLINGQSVLRRLLKALSHTARERVASPVPPAAASEIIYPRQWPPRRLPPDAATFAPCEAVPICEAVGRISAVHVGRYPPGICWLTAGDEITPEVAALLTNTPIDNLFGPDRDGMLRCVKQP